MSETLTEEAQICQGVFERLALEFLIRSLEGSDWEAVREIYLEGLSTGHATFETEAPSKNDWNQGHLRLGRIGAISITSRELLGWAALSPVSKRRAYAGVAEVSVYVRASARAKGVGSALLQALIAESEKHGIWTLQASIFPENQPSLQLHEGLGFRRVGRRERISKLNGEWRDTVILERRSRLVGVD